MGTACRERRRALRWHHRLARVERPEPGHGASCRSAVGRRRRGDAPTQHRRGLRSGISPGPAIEPVRGAALCTVRGTGIRPVGRGGPCAVRCTGGCSALRGAARLRAGHAGRGPRRAGRTQRRLDERAGRGLRSRARRPLPARSPRSLRARPAGTPCRRAGPRTGAPGRPVLRWRRTLVRRPRAGRAAQRSIRPRGGVRTRSERRDPRRR